MNLTAIVYLLSLLKIIVIKKIVVYSLSLITLAACSNNRKISNKATDAGTKTEVSPIIGGEKDEHGCIAAAGATWSELRQDCVQVFNVAQRLNPIEVKEGNAVISAFVLFNDDKSRLELFLPDIEKTVILNRSEANIYQNNIYRFDSKESALYVDGIKRFILEK